MSKIQIPLTQGKFALIDSEDFERVSHFSWRYKPNNQGNDYVARSYKHPITKKVITQFLHRFLLDVSDPGIKVDHINHDGLDNTRDNLRIATQSQNMHNRRPNRKFASSKYKGVALTKYNTWRVMIKCNGKTTSIGSYPDEIQAAKAYNEAAKKLHGEYACLNPV